MPTTKRGDRLDKKEPSSGIAEQMVQFASIISSIFEIANDQQLPGDVCLCTCNDLRQILRDKIFHLGRTFLNCL